MYVSAQKGHKFELSAYYVYICYTKYNLQWCTFMEGKVQIYAPFVHSHTLIYVMKGAPPRIVGYWGNTISPLALTSWVWEGVQSVAYVWRPRGTEKKNVGASQHLQE